MVVIERSVKVYLSLLSVLVFYYSNDEQQYYNVLKSIMLIGFSNETMAVCRVIMNV